MGEPKDQLFQLGFSALFHKTLGFFLFLVKNIPQNEEGWKETHNSLSSASWERQEVSKQYGRKVAGFKE